VSLGRTFSLASLAALVTIGAVHCSDDTTGTGGSGGEGGSPPACTVDHHPEDDAAVTPIHTPRWAFHPWISKDISDGPDTRAFLQGFEDRDIPVGVVVLDSPWETFYNTFTPNPERYPEFSTMVSDFAEKDVRVVVWVTQMINATNFDLEPGGDIYPGSSPDYETALGCGYFVNDGNQYGWWKGQGSAIDFFDPDAVVYWHRLQDRALDLGISGFKLDFAESYIEEVPIRTAAGEKTLQEYSEAYYEDFYRYGVAKAGMGDFVTMVRPYDKSYQFEGRFFARPEHAPVAWVGDNRRDYIGMQDALDEIMRSAEAGYVVLGSDIGGYLDRDDVDLTDTIPLDAEVFMRWTAMGALMPFMQLHGRANLAPWTFPERADEVTDAYRFWSKLHRALVPFFDSVAQHAYEGGDVPMIRPIGELADWPDDYRYVLGGALLVAPVVDATGTRDVPIPDDARYFDLFDLTGTPIEGGTVLADLDVSDASRIPVYVREGAIVPMEVEDDTNGLGSEGSKDALTLLVYPGDEASSFEVRAGDGSVELAAGAVRAVATTTLDLGEHPRAVLARVWMGAAPTAVEVDGAALAEVADRAAFDEASEGFFVEGGFVWIKVPAGGASTITVSSS